MPDPNYRYEEPGEGMSSGTAILIFVGVLFALFVASSFLNQL